MSYLRSHCIHTLCRCHLCLYIPITLTRTGTLCLSSIVGDEDEGHALVYHLDNHKHHDYRQIVIILLTFMSIMIIARCCTWSAPLPPSSTSTAPPCTLGEESFIKHYSMFRVVLSPSFLPLFCTKMKKTKSQTKALLDKASSLV